MIQTEHQLSLMRWLTILQASIMLVFIAYFMFFIDVKPADVKREVEWQTAAIQNDIHSLEAVVTSNTIAIQSKANTNLELVKAIASLTGQLNDQMVHWRELEMRSEDRFTGDDARKLIEVNNLKDPKEDG